MHKADHRMDNGCDHPGEENTAISLALALSATAQTTTPATPAPQSAEQPQFYRAMPDDHRASKLIGMSVTNNAGERIGDINEILLGKDGKVAAVVIGVGGFLGMGEREIAVSFDSLKLTRDRSGKTAAMLPTATKDSLKTAPEWRSPTKS